MEENPSTVKSACERDDDPARREAIRNVAVGFDLLHGKVQLALDRWSKAKTHCRSLKSGRSTTSMRIHPQSDLPVCRARPNGSVGRPAVSANLHSPAALGVFLTMHTHHGEGGRQCCFCPQAAEITSTGCQPRRQTLKKTMTFMQKRAQNPTRAMVRIASRTSSGKLGQIRLPARSTTTLAASKKNRPRGPMPGLRRWRDAVFAIRALYRSVVWQTRETIQTRLPGSGRFAPVPAHGQPRLPTSPVSGPAPAPTAGRPQSLPR